MKKIKGNLLFVVLCFAVGFVGCSDQYLLRKVYEKGLLENDTTVTTKSDTVTQTKVKYEFIEIPVEKTVTKDSIYCDSNNLPVLVLGDTTSTTDNIELIRNLRGNILTTIAQRDSQRIRIKTLEETINITNNRNKTLVKLNSRLKEQLEKTGYSFMEAVGLGVIFVILLGLLGFGVRKFTHK